MLGLKKEDFISFAAEFYCFSLFDDVD